MDAKGEEEDAASAPGKRAVEVTVAMTRCLYAQLEQQHFAAPTRLAMAWKANLGRCDDGPSLHRGAKITAAFEMIFARAEKTPSSSVAMPPRVLSQLPTGDDLLTLPEEELAAVIEQIMASPDDDDDDGEQKTAANNAISPVDDDAWMRVTPGELEEMMKAQAPPPIIDESTQDAWRRAEHEQDQQEEEKEKEAQEQREEEAAAGCEQRDEQNRRHDDFKSDFFGVFGFQAHFVDFLNRSKRVGGSESRGICQQGANITFHEFKNGPFENGP